MHSAHVTHMQPVLLLNASHVSVAHTVCAYSAFAVALIVGCYCHYYKIVENAWFGYPDEWFPSVSATIGDRYPERLLFQIVIAVTSGPRFLLIGFNALCLYLKLITVYVMLVSGILRTFTCGGWVYITSTDDHDWHDVFMISYILLTIPWTITVSALSEKLSLVRKGRTLTALAFFAMMAPLVYLFIQHKVYRVPGAYSYYAYVEWLLILLDVAFDSWSVLDFKRFEIRVYDVSQQKETGSATEANVVTEVTTETVVETVVEEKVEVTTAATSAHKVSDEVSTFRFLADVINAYVFFTGFTSLYVCVWYFPLWNMGLSGYEAVITVKAIAPLLLALPFLRRAFQRLPAAPRLLAVLFIIGAYKVQNPEQRLLAITVGMGFAVIGLASELAAYYHDPPRFNSLWTANLLGLLGTLVLKYVCRSNNPAWPIMHKENGGYNEWAIAITLLSALFTSSYKIEPTSRKGGSLLLAALGLGSYIFCLELFLSDSSTMIIWAWDGFPVTGPTPITGAHIHFAAFAAGILFSVVASANTLTTIPYTMAGVGFAVLLSTYQGWKGYAGLTGFTFYLASLAPIVTQLFVGYHPAALFGLAFFFNVVLCLSSVWIVAYAFVPGGYLLRERTDIMVAVSVLTLVLGVVNYKLRMVASHITRLRSSPALLRNSLRTLAILCAISAGGLFHRLPTEAPAPYNPHAFTAGIWCVHFGLDNDMWLSEVRMLNLLREAEVDVVGLLETDTQRLVGGNRDFVQKIAEELNMYVDYGPGPNKHTWGAALLSKFPIVRSLHHLLPSPVGELAPAIVATLDIHGTEVDTIVFHSGQEEDVEDRRLQSQEIARLAGESTNPLMLLSYLVVTPLEGNYNTYVSNVSRLHDIDSTDWDRWCEYILFRDLKKVAYARLSRSTITDTELQIAKFTLLTDEQMQRGDDYLYGNHFVEEQHVPEEFRMPALFRGDGVRGHRYHVFDEPRYFD